MVENRQELTYKSMQRLMSNGSAGNTLEVFQEMIKMHPKRKKELKSHIPPVTQVHVKKQQAKRYIYRLTSQDQSCPGIFA